jgi:pilus assembly protein CpaC
MNRRIVASMAFLSLAFFSNAHARAERVIRLTVGQSQVVAAKGTVTRVQVLDPKVADVAHYSTRSATVVGVNSGTTELLITTTKGRRKYSIVVTAVELGRLYKQVRSYLGRIEGIYPRLIGNSVIISGAALTADDYAKAERAVRLLGNKVKNHVSFKPSAVQQINQIFQRSGLTDVRTRLVGGTLFIEGAVGSKEEKTKVAALLRTYGLASVENLVTVGGGRQVLVDVQFVEMRKRGLNKIGIQWPDVLGASVNGTNLTGTVPITGGATTMNLQVGAQVMPTSAALNMLFSNGKARLLAQPKLVCASGKSAEFVVGGEVPVVVITQNVVDIKYKEFGIKLKIKPTADGFGNVKSQIYAEVSEPDASLSVKAGGNEIPGFRTRKFKTFVSVKDGASIVLSGLFSNSEQKAVSKLPLLGHIPILGELFKSREFQELKTTLVVFVTPKVVSPKHPWVRKTIRDIQKLYEEYEAEIGWQLFD